MATFDHLLSPLQAGDMHLKHRVVMSAMTRLRNDPITEAPRDLNVLYYSQRTSDGGLLISEGACLATILHSHFSCNTWVILSRYACDTRIIPRRYPDDTRAVIL
jgi:2,4-dienoyl-CoA reductase-like NADH-dependent reductase (Old Yellow Enzyme family)